MNSRYTKVSLMKSIIRPAAILVAGLILSLNAWAMSLQEAKSQGFLGEQLNGYLGVVKANSDASAVMNEVNGKRRAQYEKIAKKNNISASDVAKLAAQKAIAAADKGHYVQDANGKWVKK